jgi:hypothetical protein
MPAPSQQDIQAGVPAGANIVKRVPAPSGKGELLLDANGGVYDTGGQSFSGSYHSLAPDQRQGTRSFQDIVVDPQTGGYKLVSNIPGQEYNFGPSDYVKNQTPYNPIYKDPAYLSFLANSGMTYEDAARQTSSKTQALNTALASTIPQLQEQGQDSLKGIYGRYADRGLYGAGQQAVDEGKAQAATNQAIGTAQTNTSQDIADLQSNLATTRRNMLNDATTRGYGVAGGQDLTNRYNAVDQKYPLGKSTPSDMVGA